MKGMDLLLTKNSLAFIMEILMDTAPTYPADTLDLDEKSREMIEAGVFYGKKKSKTHPKTKQYVIANRGGIEIINLVKTSEGLERALKFLEEKVAAGGLILFVGTQPPAQDAITSVATSFGQPYVTFRWVGGALTNFKVIFGRVEYLKKLRSGMASGDFDKYTKKERIGIEREIGRLTKLMGGLENLSKIPDLLIVIDPNVHTTAMREAKRLNIPIIALADTDSDLEVISYPVVGNSKSTKSITWFLGKIQQTFEAARSRRILEAKPIETSEKTGAEPKTEVKK